MGDSCSRRTHSQRHSSSLPSSKNAAKRTSTLPVLEFSTTCASYRLPMRPSSFMLTSTGFPGFSHVVTPPNRELAVAASRLRFCPANVAEPAAGRA